MWETSDVGSSVREMGGVAGGGGFRARNRCCGGWSQVLCTKRVMQWVVAGSVRKTGEAAGGRGFRA